MMRLKQRGDTIVEVLICIMIVSLILTGAYVTTNKSTLAVSNSQEHATALKLIQSQLEELRTNANQQSPTVFAKAAPFCMVNGVATSATQQPDAAQCIVDANDNATTAQPAYKLTITRVDASDSAVFQVRADWDSITGSGNTSEQISYRLYK